MLTVVVRRAVWMVAGLLPAAALFYFDATVAWLFAAATWANVVGYFEGRVYARSEGF